MIVKRTILAVLIVALFMPACKKYSEGPSLSFRSRAERVANTWKMELVLFNGTDVTTAYTSLSYTETYDKEGVYSYNSTLGGGSGKWAFESNDAIIKRNGVSGQSTADLNILRLKEKSFWYTIQDGKDLYEFHLIPNK